MSENEANKLDKLGFKENKLYKDEYVDVKLGELLVINQKAYDRTHKKDYYAWDVMKKSLEDEGYNPENHFKGYIWVQKLKSTENGGSRKHNRYEDGRKLLYKVRDGNHRVVLMKEIYGNDYVIKARLKNNICWDCLGISQINNLFKNKKNFILTIQTLVAVWYFLIRCHPMGLLAAGIFIFMAIIGPKIGTLLNYIPKEIVSKSVKNTGMVGRVVYSIIVQFPKVIMLLSFLAIGLYLFITDFIVFTIFAIFMYVCERLTESILDDKKA